MTQPTPTARPRSPMHPRRARGLSLVELMVAMGLGLVLVIGVASVYLFTKTAFGRQSQLSTLQQSVRTAFEYLGSDARMVGHLGCSTGNPAVFVSDLSTVALATNFAVGIEGYDYANTTTGGAYTLGSDNPADSTTASEWTQNLVGMAPLGIRNLPLTDLGGSLTPGSDVLVIRTVSGRPMRLTNPTTPASNQLPIERITNGRCSDGADMVSGFCRFSYGLIASCSAARAFQVNSIGSPITTTATGSQGFVVATTEVFPLQTIAYYVKRSSSGTTTSLYRRLFTGDPAAGVEQELIEDVESMQLRYGIDSTLPDPVGAVDTYTTADSVSDWSRVVAIRMSLLMRSATPVTADTKVATSAPVNGVTITFPTGSRYDRRVFTTTVALRNRIAYFPPSP